VTTATTTNPALRPFAARRTALLTTYKRDGTPVDTPVTLAIVDGRIFIRSYDKAWKTKRMRNHPEVRIAPSTIRGKPRGPAMTARSRLLDGDEAARAAQAIARRQRILQGILVPLFHRLKRYRTLHYELTPE
jgi:uncharacterized protein